MLNKVAKSFAAFSAAVLAAASTIAGAAPANAAPDGWKSEPISSRQAGSQQCKQAVFIGARGSGEDPAQSRTIRSIRDQIAEQPGVVKDIRQVYIDYPAVSIDPSVLQNIQTLLLDEDITKVEYWDSTEKGAAEVTRLLVENVERCPNEKIVIVGFSQGAEAVNRGLTLAIEKNSKVADNLLAAVLLGNPGNYSGQNVQILDGQDNEGSGGLSTTLRFLRSRALDGPDGRYEQVQAIVKGIFDLYDQRVPKEELQPIMAKLNFAIPDSIHDRVYSVCNDGDMICDAVPALTRILSAQSSVNTELSKSEPQHLSYPDTAKQTVAAVGRSLAELPQKSTKPGHNEPGESGEDDSGLGWWLGGGAVLAVLGAAFGIVRGRRKD